MEQKVRHCPGCRRSSCTGCGIFQKLNTNKQISVSFPKDFVADKREGFGISFDMGTTTLAGMLWDLEGAVCMETAARANPQALWGADVISRLQFAMKGQEELSLLQQKVVQAMDQMAEEISVGLFQQEIKDQSLEKTIQSLIRKVTVAGNTAMCELFMGIKPEGLAQVPFLPDYQGVKRFLGRELGFKFLADAEICVLPPIGGYVGADALAVYAYLEKEKKPGYILAVDIGTNGEILLLTQDKKYACSAAAGPALEGGGAVCGMRAAPGAVDMVSVGGRFPQQDLVCRVIGGGKPIGICGSGLVDGLACLLQAGVMDGMGYLRNGKEARRAGAPERICKRIEAGPKGNRILLTDQDHPVYLYGEDIRQLQLAIGAIRAGIEVLLEKAEITSADLDKIYLAGAFGCYLNIESSMAAGLLPRVEKEKVVQAGNLAGTGAAMALLSETVLENMERQARELCHIELAGDDHFQELFLKYINPAAESLEKEF